MLEAENNRGPFQSLFEDFFTPSRALFRKHKLMQSHLEFLYLVHDQVPVPFFKSRRHQVKAIYSVWLLFMEELCAYLFFLLKTFVYILLLKLILAPRRGLKLVTGVWAKLKM